MRFWVYPLVGNVEETFGSLLGVLENSIGIARTRVVLSGGQAGPRAGFMFDGIIVSELKFILIRVDQGHLYGSRNGRWGASHEA